MLDLSACMCQVGTCACPETTRSVPSKTQTMSPEWEEPIAKTAMWQPYDQPGSSTMLDLTACMCQVGTYACQETTRSVPSKTQTMSPEWEESIAKP